MDKEKAREEIENLVEKYNRIVEDNRVKEYNEEMTKKDFILPLFRALGWKVEDSTEVTAEEKISKGRVDYGFRISGISKFFLEAKSLKVDLDNEKFFEQAISYAWHKGCTWAVLTDFEAVKILNAEWKAANYLQSHFTTIYSREFLDRFDELWLLSKESFEKGLLDKKAEKWGKKTKKASIDNQLLADFTRFRELLSKNITKLNQSKKLKEEELDESVQRILDRLIFIRNCEDRELEPKFLISKLRERKGKGKLVKSLREVFDYFDKNYDSKIFVEHLCDHLAIDDEVIDEIVKGLYYTKEKYFTISYDFSAIDADVLGNIYEQYLSHILKKTEKRAKLSESRIHRKKQGIYYTPTYIVDYIVRNTLGELLKDKKTNTEKIRVLDPACGSGSFLIKAFDVLNEYYKNEKDYTQTRLDFKTGIPFTKKVGILQNNIFGADLDKQAVEIAQLNLLLKIAERGQRLPLLEENIKCGNSLIADKKLAGNKAFKWEEEFGEIIKEGGFDVVIGNPPYGSELRRREFYYFKREYISAEYKIDTYGLFIERGLDLLKDGGYFGFIIPNTILTNKYFQKLRTKILGECQILSLLNFGYDVFPDSKMDSLIIILRKEPDHRKRESNMIMSAKIEKPVVSLSSIDFKKGIEQSDFLRDAQHAFNVDRENSELLSKIRNTCNGIVLGSLVNINLGFRVKNNEELIHFTKHTGDVLILHGRDISRYSIMFQNRYFTYRKQDITGGYSKREVYEADEKLLIQAIRNIKLRRRIVGAYDDSQFFVIGGLLSVTKKLPTVNLKYLLALLNSQLLNFYFKSLSIDKNIKVVFLKQLPIKQPTPQEERKIVKLVDKMLSLNERVNEIGEKLTDERARIENEIKKVDRQIDELVYEIYEINETEQRIIEDSL